MKFKKLQEAFKIPTQSVKDKLISLIGHDIGIEHTTIIIPDDIDPDFSNRYLAEEIGELLYGMSTFNVEFNNIRSSYITFIIDSTIEVSIDIYKNNSTEQGNTPTNMYEIYTVVRDDIFATSSPIVNFPIGEPIDTNLIDQNLTAVLIKALVNKNK